MNWIWWKSKRATEPTQRGKCVTEGKLQRKILTKTPSKFALIGIAIPHIQFMHTHAVICTCTQQDVQIVYTCHVYLCRLSLCMWQCKRNTDLMPIVDLREIMKTTVASVIESSIYISHVFQNRSRRSRMHRRRWRWRRHLTIISDGGNCIHQTHSHTLVWLLLLLFVYFKCFF